MQINTNTWNRIRYSLYAPGYDIAGRLLNKSRKKSIDSLELEADDKVLIVGAGTGLDLEHMNLGCDITATDITPAMVERIKRRSKKMNQKVKSMVMDGQDLDFENDSFDFVILHLILAVIPDPSKCLIEAERVLKKGGHVAIYDKFVRKGKTVSRFRRSVNLITNLLFSDITRDFESIHKLSSLELVSDSNADFNGNFRLIKLKKG